MTGLYAPEAAAYLTGNLRHEVTATAVLVPYAPLPLEIKDIEFTFAEDWSPQIQASITVPAPADETVYDILDPRKRCKILIAAGYTYPDNTTDVQPIADLYLRTRGVRRPDDTVELTAASGESLAQDARLDPWVAWTANRAGLNEWVTWLAVHAMYPEVPEIVSTFGAGFAPGSLADIAVEAGMDCWGLIAEAAARTGAWVYSDGNRWIITRRPAVLSAPLHTLTAGEAGTIFETGTDLGRDGFANISLVTYKWKDATGKDLQRSGWAVIDSGPLSPPVAGRCVDYLDAAGPITQDAANQVARARLDSLSSRSRTVTALAHAAYWLRPSQTIDLQLLTGASERVLVRAVTFAPLKGTMAVTTRQAPDASIRVGE